MSDQRTILDILNFEELEVLESLVGKEYHQIFGKGLSARASYCLHWILEKRANPEADIEDSKKLKLPFLNDYIKGFLNDPKEI